MIVHDGTEDKFIGHEWVHAVDRDKLLRHGVRHAKVIFGGPWNAADDLTFADTPKVIVDPLSTS
jgi:hypothetical protein